jgi:hypothetical protein
VSAVDGQADERQHDDDRDDHRDQNEPTAARGMAGGAGDPRLSARWY